MDTDIPCVHCDRGRKKLTPKTTGEVADRDLGKEDKMKIVRVTIKVGGSNLYFDKPFDEKLDDFGNTDAALKFLTEMYEQKKVLAVMLMPVTPTNIEIEKGKYRQDPFIHSIPALLNLDSTQFITIENAGVYDVETSE